jgi:hypothetical protein
MALGSTQPLTEMSARNLPVCKGWPARFKYISFRVLAFKVLLKHDISYHLY